MLKFWWPHILRGIPALALIVVGVVGVLWLDFSQTVYYALIAGSLGLSIGKAIGFAHGMKARERILEEIYGPEWRADLSWGYYRRGKAKEASKN